VNIGGRRCCGIGSNKFLVSSGSLTLGNRRVSSSADATLAKMACFFQRGEQFLASSALACIVSFVRLGPQVRRHRALVFAHGVMIALELAIEGNVPTLLGATSWPSFQFEKGNSIRLLWCHQQTQSNGVKYKHIGNNDQLTQSRTVSIR
jgi:hypothetical protein